MNPEHQKYIAAAQEELLNPTFAVTKQYLDVLELESENGKPKVERVDSASEDVFVYFQIKNERFFVQVLLIKNPEPVVKFVAIESGHRVYITATSEDLTYAELAELLPYAYTEGWSKGDLRTRNDSVYKFSIISYEPIKSEAYDLNKKLELLLNELEQNAEAIRELTKKSDAVIVVCKHQYVSANAGVTFNIELINRLSNLNLGVSIDTYIGGDYIK